MTRLPFRLVAVATRFLRHTHLACLTLLLAVMTTGCFDIQEDITLRADGSGTYVTVTDMTQMMALISSMGQDSTGDGTSSTATSLDSTFREVVKVLSGVPGLHNVAYQAEGYVYTLSYDFDNVDALNEGNARNNTMAGQTPGMNPSASYTWKSGELSKTSPPVADLLGEMGDDDEMEQAMTMIKMFMADAHFTSVFHLPGKVKKTSNKEAQLSDGNTTVTLKTNFVSFLEGKSSPALTIKYKK
ncbi:MAG: hypothetical protein SF053_08660 [Bacteroidia bacterium]|nr:hypothetical protein [Bacteroidia bacterium]